MEKIRVAIAGVGNCASSLIQGVTYYRDAKPGDDVPGLMHVVLGGYHVSDLEFVAAFDVDASKVGNDLGKAIDGGPEQHHQVRRRALARRHRPARADDGRAQQVLPRGHRGVPAEPVDVVQALRDAQGRGARLVPAGRLRGRPALLRPGRHRRRRRLRQRHPRLHRLGPGRGPRSSPTPACRSSATTSRARSARRSCTACWRASSRTAASPSTTPTSSTSAATWTSRTCSTVSASSPRRSPRPRR